MNDDDGQSNNFFTLSHVLYKPYSSTTFLASTKQETQHK